MRTLARPALIDTNVLVAALFPDHVHHERSRALLDRVQDGTIAACLTPQVLAEFYAVVTSPRRVTVPRSSADALGAVRQLLAIPGVRMLPIPPDVVQRWIALARRFPATRGGIFDLQLAATMKAAGIRTIYTYNRPDFVRLPGITVRAP